MEVLNALTYWMGLVLDSAWLWLPFFLSIVFFESWMYYAQRFHWSNLPWIMLEVKPPKEIEKTPKNMEQIFAGLWGSFGSVGTKYEKYIKGVIQDYFSFEIVGLGGEIHFYIRTAKKFRSLVEAQIYSQYAQAEIREVEDYFDKIPKDLPNKNFDLWGCRLSLAKDDVYPIRTYQQLLDQSRTDEPFLDPVASLMEYMGKLNPGEMIIIQLIFRPYEDAWQGRAIEKAFKLIGKKMPPPAIGAFKTETKTWYEAVREVLYEFFTDKQAPPLKDEDKKGDLPSLMMHLSPGEKDIVTGIEEKAGKKGFQAKVQWAYIGRRDVFSMANVSATMGIFSQFANLNMNSFVPDKETMTRAYYVFAKARKVYKQRFLMRLLRQRSFWEKGYILNIEELASFYHFPTVAVTAPMTPYTEAKKSGPPADLPLL